MVEIKLVFNDRSEAKRAEDCLALLSQMPSFDSKDRGALLRGAIQIKDQLDRMAEKEDGGEQRP